MGFQGGSQAPRIAAMGKTARICYYVLGALAVISLVSAYWSPWQRLNQILTTVGICGMVFLAAWQDIRRDKKQYMIQRFGRDLAFLLLWGILLWIWVRDV